jgi:putative CocE/NonD family hydrolase
MVTGWYDIFLPWQLRTYAALVGAGNQPRLTIGPWGHVSPEMSGPTHIDTVAFLREEIGGAVSTRPAPVRVFRTGAECWHDLPAWPPVEVTAVEWFLQPGGGLARTAAGGGATSYTYEPRDPTPSVGGPTLGPDTLPMDNARHERRTDVVSFRSEPLDAPVSIAGNPVARIRVRGSAPSFDLFVRLTDAGPGGRVITVCDGLRRVGSIGTTETDPVPDDAGFREVEIELWPTFHEFAAGHRIGVQISSGAHPRYARNPGTGEPAAVAERTLPSRQELSHDGPAGCRVELPVWPG